MSYVKKIFGDILVQFEHKFGNEEKAAQEVVEKLHLMDYKKMGNKFMMEFKIKLGDTESLMSTTRQEELFSSRRPGGPVQP